MSFKILCCLTIAGILTGLFPLSVLATPGELDYVRLNTGIEYLLKESEITFTAGGFDSNNDPISGLIFTWSVVNGGGNITNTYMIGSYSKAVFKAGTTLGTFYDTVKVVATQGTNMRYATATITVVDYPPYIYQAESGKCQYLESPGTDNCVDYSWAGVAPSATPPYTLYWGASTTDPIYPDVGAVIGNWQTAIPYLPFAEATTEHPPKLVLYYRQSPCLISNALGCHWVTAGNSIYNADRAAFYWDVAIIEINSNLVPAGPLARSVIAHEVGHHYGLDERYLLTQTPFGLSGVCNKYERTLMNISSLNDPDCPLLNAPTKLDIQRVDMFWRGGAPLTGIETRGDLPIMADSIGPVATFRWQDMAWAEKSHLIVFEYLDPDLSEWVILPACPRLISLTLLAATCIPSPVRWAIQLISPRNHT